MPVPLYVLHYKGNVDRRAYLEAKFAETGLSAHWITECDAGEFDPGAHYVFDPSLYRTMVDPIKELMVGYYVGREFWPDVPWSECVDRVRREKLTLEKLEQAEPWLQPEILNVPYVSLALKHRLAWERIAAGADEWAIVAEDDVIFLDDSVPYLSKLAAALPVDADYIDLAGGCKLYPRPGNRVVNRFFFEIDPPRERTICCALMRRQLARRIVALRPPICLPIDWTVTWFFNKLRAKVYWVDPLLFGHGSEMKVYQSNLR